MWERAFFIHPAILRIRQFISKWGLYHPDTLRLPRDQRRKDLLGLLLAVLRAVPRHGILRLAVHRHHLGGPVRLVADPRHGGSQRHLAQRPCEAVEAAEAGPVLGTAGGGGWRIILADRQRHVSEGGSDEEA